MIALVKQSLEIPVYANGDINTPEKAKYVLDYTKADGLYIGRGSLGRPWIFRQIKDYLANGSYTSFTITEILAVIIKHINNIYLHYPEVLACRYARKHLKYYLQNLFPDAFQAKFAKISDSGSKLEQLSLIEQMLVG